MKKPYNKCKQLTATACVVALLLTMTQQVSAEDVRSSESTATVSFEKGQGPTKPVDPETPEKPMNPDEEDAVDGHLSIVYASDFAFGTVKLTAGKGEYPITTIQPNVQVVDLRGEGDPWKLTAVLSEFYLLDEGGEATATILPGASVYISEGRINSELPVGQYPQSKSAITLSADTESTLVMEAISTTGYGLFVNRFYPPTAQEGQEQKPPYVYLKVPAGNASLGNYKATITWSIGDAP